MPSDASQEHPEKPHPERPEEFTDEEIEELMLWCWWWRNGRRDP